MTEKTTSKQAIAGFKVLTFQVKKSKDTEKVKLVLEADVEDISAGTYDMGDVLKALLTHQTSEDDVGLTVFVK